MGGVWKNYRWLVFGVLGICTRCTSGELQGCSLFWTFHVRSWTTNSEDSLTHSVRSAMRGSAVRARASNGEATMDCHGTLLISVTRLLQNQFLFRFLWCYSSPGSASVHVVAFVFTFVCVCPRVGFVSAVVKCIVLRLRVSVFSSPECLFLVCWEGHTSTRWETLTRTPTQTSTHT